MVDFHYADLFIWPSSSLADHLLEWINDWIIESFTWPYQSLFKSVTWPNKFFWPVISLCRQSNFPNVPFNSVLGVDSFGRMPFDCNNIWPETVWPNSIRLKSFWSNADWLINPFGRNSCDWMYRLAEFERFPLDRNEFGRALLGRIPFSRNPFFYEFCLTELRLVEVYLAVFHSTDFHLAEFHVAEYRLSEIRLTEFRLTEFRLAESRLAECHLIEFHFSEILLA